MESKVLILDLLQNDYSKEIIAGVIAGLFIILIQYAYNYIKNVIMFNKYKGFVGDYFTYSISTKSSRSISAFAYQIKYSYGKLVLVSKTNDLRYKGKVFITDKNIYFYGKGLDHEEYTLMTFHKPFNNKLTSSIGVFSGVSILNEPTSKVILITNKKIHKEKAREILLAHNIIEEKLLTIVPTSEKFYTNQLIEDE